jgi:dynein assembly factor 1
MGALKTLHSLQLASNHLRTLDALAGLRECPALSVLDLSNNNLDGDGAALIELLQALPEISVLYLVGNPIVNQIRSYRKTLISKLPKLACAPPPQQPLGSSLARSLALVAANPPSPSSFPPVPPASKLGTRRYLDDRPIFDSERLCAAAWAEGGIEAEREERRRQSAQKEADAERQMAYMRNLIGGKKPRGIDIDPESTEISDADDSEEESEEEVEPPELVAARKKLAAYSARPGEAVRPLGNSLITPQSDVGVCESDEWGLAQGRQRMDLGLDHDGQA